MFLRPPSINTTEEGDDYKEGRLRYFIDHYLARYDVICLQECFSLFRPWKEELIHEAQKQGLLYHVCSPMPGYFGSELCDGGLLILSRYPIDASEFESFQAPSLLGDCIALKGLLYARIDLSRLGGTCLHLFNTHTQATEHNLETEALVQTFVTRYEQIKEVRQLIK